MLDAVIESLFTIAIMTTPVVIYGICWFIGKIIDKIKWKINPEKYALDWVNKHYKSRLK